MVAEDDGRQQPSYFTHIVGRCHVGRFFFKVFVMHNSPSSRFKSYPLIFMLLGAGFLSAMFQTWDEKESCVGQAVGNFSWYLLDKEGEV